MYPLLDKIAPVKEIQKYLHFINDRGGDVTRVAIDGIYGGETYVAVKEFQSANGLLVTGLVDFGTFERLKAVYAELTTDEKGYVLTSQGFPIGIGMQGNDVVNIHAIISELKNTYKELEFVGNGRYFSIASEKATKQLQRIFGMTESGEIDEALYNRMMKEIDAIQNLNKNYVDGALFWR